MITFQTLRPELLETVGRWRELEHINKFQLTRYNYSSEQQKRWYDNLLKTNMIEYTWVVYIDNLPIGYLAINDIDGDFGKGKTVYWGYYMGDLRFKGLGSIIPTYFYNYVFSDEFGADNVQAQVYSDNKNVLKIHRMHGYEVDATDKVVTKDNRIINLVYLTLKKDVWLKQHQRWHGLKMVIINKGKEAKNGD